MTDTSFQTLATQKQSKASGGHNNYWLQELDNGTVVEAEDIIENMEMLFADGTTFKSLWRLCKERQGLGKPGSTPLYEAQKDVYYSGRTLELVLRRTKTKGVIGRSLASAYRKARWFFASFVCSQAYDPLDYFQHEIVWISNPKRLAPYQFRVSDLLKALGTNDMEAALFVNLLVGARARQRVTWRLPPLPQELRSAKRASLEAKMILDTYAPKEAS